MYDLGINDIELAFIAGHKEEIDTYLKKIACAVTNHDTDLAGKTTAEISLYYFKMGRDYEDLIGHRYQPD